MKNGQLKPGDNVQMGTENRFVVALSVHQRPGDSACLVPHLEEQRARWGTCPGTWSPIHATNYAYLEENGVGNYVKYSGFDRKRRKGRANRFSASAFTYDPMPDDFLCPAGQRLMYRRTSVRTTEAGYRRPLRNYEATGCEGCRWRSECTRPPTHRWLQVSIPLEAMRSRTPENLRSERGQQLRSQRLTEVESVFGRLKHNWGFRRFRLRGDEKVKWGLLCMAHNPATIPA